MMNTPEETTWMAAADRLRRIEAGERQDRVYDLSLCDDEVKGRVADDLESTDRATLADAFLSLWPAEPEPVACRCDPGSLRFAITEQGGIREIRTTDEGETLGVSRLPIVYPTESAARLALRWQRLREVRAMGEKPE